MHLVYIYIKVKLVTLIECNLKALFSKATTSRFWGERYSIPWIALLDPYLIVLSAKQGSIKYHFKYDTPWDLTPVSPPRPLVNIPGIMLMAWSYIYIYIYIYFFEFLVRLNLGLNPGLPDH